MFLISCHNVSNAARVIRRMLRGGNGFQPARRIKNNPWVDAKPVAEVHSGGSSACCATSRSAAAGDVLKCALALSRNARVEARAARAAPTLEHAKLGGTPAANCCCDDGRGYSGDFLAPSRPARVLGAADAVAVIGAKASEVRGYGDGSIHAER